MNTHTKEVESSGRQNGHRHPTLYFILVSILQDAKYIIIMLYSRWRPIHQSVNWCGWLYTRPGFTEKWSTAWEQKQMKCMYMRVVSVHLSDLRQGYLCKRKIIRIIYCTHKKKEKKNQPVLSLSSMIPIYSPLFQHTHTRSSQCFRSGLHPSPRGISESAFVPENATGQLIIWLQQGPGI